MPQELLSWNGRFSFQLRQGCGTGTNWSRGIGNQTRDTLWSRTIFHISFAQSQRQVEQHLLQTPDLGAAWYGKAGKRIGAVQHSMPAQDVGEFLREQFDSRDNFRFEQEHSSKSARGPSVRELRSNCSSLRGIK